MSYQSNPVLVSSNGKITIRNVAFANSRQAVNISLLNGEISDIQNVDEPISWTCLPPLSDMHVHANRAFTIGDVKPDSFESSIQLTLELLQSFGEEQYCKHALKLFECAYSHCTTAVRTHADIDNHTGLEAVKGTLGARNVVGKRMDIDVVAFASVRMDPATPEGKSVLSDAVDLGADFIGAVPSLYPNPEKSIDALMELAIELQVPIDVHQDEHLNMDNVWSEYLADATISYGLQGMVTLSHGCALAVLDNQRRNRIISKLSDAGISVIALPTTNLYLQDRCAGTPLRRGLTCIQELLAAGIEVRFASDNVRDAFYPYGDADMLDTAYLAIMASQIDTGVNLLKSICAGRSSLKIGDTADMVLVKAESFGEVVSKRPWERLLIRHGKLIPELSFQS